MGIDSNYAYHFQRNVSVTTTGVTFTTAYNRGYNLPSADNFTEVAIPLNIYGLNYN